MTAVVKHWRFALVAGMVSCGGRISGQDVSTSGSGDADAPFESSSLDSAPIDSDLVDGGADSGFDPAPVDSDLVDGGADSGFDSAPVNSQPVDGGADGNNWCPMTGSFCPPGCSAVHGNPYEASENCLASDELVGCVYEYSGCTAMTCRLKTSPGAPGVFYQFGSCVAPLEPDVPGWSECSQADSIKVLGAGLCGG